MELSSRSAPYLLIILPVPFFLFAVGTSKWFWAALTLDVGRIRRDVLDALAYEALPLLLIGSFALGVLVSNVLPGQYTWRDPYYQNVISDPTLILTPFLGFALLAFLVYILATEWRSMAPRPPTAASTA